MRKTLLLSLTAALFVIVSCSKSENKDSNDDPTVVANDVQLEFKNTFGDTEIVLAEEASSVPTTNTSEAGQIHYFSELKYVISNIRLIKDDETVVSYNTDDLDKGATLVNQSKPATLHYILKEIPTGEYVQIRFGLGVNTALNTLDQVKFPIFYAAAEENDTEMMWEWGTGYRFTKIEGFYDVDNKEMSIHTGSTIESEEGAYTQGVDAYRDITLILPKSAIVGDKSPKIIIKADFHKLLSGKSNTITLSTGTGPDNNATPNTHSAVQMLKFVDNIGGDGEDDTQGMFSILDVINE